ncbi:MAG: response regulator transcription factor [Bernardetiaceae bacterium]|jgi:DNA-binding NarL/FixJ family response regulator|nr:response regulator transcription factor [Bernardetiaceae bacterium]
MWTSPDPVNLLLVDDHPMVIEGLRSLLQTAPGLQVVGQAGNAYAALELVKAHPVHVVLLDINLPETDGIEFCRKLKLVQPDIKVLGISTFKERSYISKMLEAGATGYVPKSVGRDELLQAIREVAAGRTYLPADILAILVQAPPPGLPPLTRREKEVLGCIAQGFTNPQIAEKLYISQLTVDSHRKNLLAKLGVKNTAALIKLAVENGLV